jgi:hypothetical protein
MDPVAGTAYRPKAAVGGPVTFVKGRQDDILISEEVWASLAVARLQHS